MKTIIIGGVASGATTATRLRRLNEDMEIIMVERGEFISFANCGLPYHIGGVIADRDDLLMMTPESFRTRFNMEVRIREEAVAIDRAAKYLSIRRADGGIYRESYDKLVIATGSSPIIPTLPGIENPNVFFLWTLSDMDRIVGALDEKVKTALVVGAGFIGVETAENLQRRGLATTVVEARGHPVPANLDPEMATPLVAEMKRLGITLLTGRRVARFDGRPDGITATLDDGQDIPADLIIVSVGIRPNSAIAEQAGLEMGEHGHIKVDAGQRTSDPDIYAVGDVSEVADPILGGSIAVPLAGPANKQARVAADNLSGLGAGYPGSIGSAVVKLGNIAVATVGHNEEQLRRRKAPYQRVYVNSQSNAGYYPDSVPLHLKLLFAADGRVLGAQAVGEKGVDKRIDVIAAVIGLGGRVQDLAMLELCYSPPFNLVRDPVNIAGMNAMNVLDGDSRPVYPDRLPERAVLVDVRQPEEVRAEPLPGAVNIPLGELRDRLGELDPSSPAVVVCCQVGHRGYLAERILLQHGFNAHNLSGGYVTWRMFHPEEKQG